ncbi:MAG TPA: hypothetical protein VFT08_09230 [Pyrinomonadaceae bacterium]|nr:hypothetical protein [Pyrinomonadaceae bacterium]
MRESEEEACYPWQVVCISPEDHGGPCSNNTTPPWRTSVEIERLDLDECGPKECELSIVRVNVALFESGPPLGLPDPAGTRALELFVGAILDITLAGVNDKSDSASGADFIDLKQSWLPPEPEVTGPHFQPLFRTARRASFLLSPPATLFQDTNESLDGTYTVYIGLTRPTEAPFPCIGVTLDRARLSAQRREGDPESAIHTFPYQVFAQAKEKPDIRQHVEEVTRTLIYTPPDGWILDPAAGHEVRVRNAVQAKTPSVAVREDGTLAVEGSARSRYWADAPIVNARLQSGQIEADVMVHLRRRETSATYTGDKLSLQRLDICCCPRQTKRTQEGPPLQRDVSRHGILMTAVDGSSISDAQAARSASTVTAELRRAAASAHKGA